MLHTIYLAILCFGFIMSVVSFVREEWIFGIISVILWLMIAYASFDIELTPVLHLKTSTVVTEEYNYIWKYYPDNYFWENFTYDAGFIYDPELVMFDNGTLRQRFLLEDNMTFLANFNHGFTANYAVGNASAEVHGNATITDGELNLATNDTSYVLYHAEGNADFPQKGTIRLKVRPNYTGAPAETNQYFFTIEYDLKNTRNVLTLFHSTSGFLFLRIHNDSNNPIVLWSFGSWSPTAGQQYEFELNYDLDTGAHRLFIDGQLFGTVYGTGTRGETHVIILGNYPTYSALMKTNIFIDDFAVFNDTKHTSDYTPEFYAYDYPYMATSVQLPTFICPYDNATIAYVEYVNTDATDGVRYIVDGKYFDLDENTWKQSDGSYNQANTLDELNYYIKHLKIQKDELNFNLVFPNSTTENNISTMYVEYVMGIPGALDYVVTTTNETYEPAPIIRVKEPAIGALSGMMAIVMAAFLLLQGIYNFGREPEEVF